MSNHIADVSKKVNDTPRTNKEAFLPHDSKYRVCDVDFARQLERELNAANQRIKRLEEAGDAMTNCIACGCNDGGCTTCRGYEDKWVKAKEAKL